jgi:hypothetical protein|tara:strand:- start:6465 stop:6602 length:138 start_codon:yes stop_codon:yes gene_type:complete
LPLPKGSARLVAGGAFFIGAPRHFGDLARIRPSIYDIIAVLRVVF